MELTLLSCGIFKPELDTLVPMLQKELGLERLDIVYLPSGLHIEEKRLEAGILHALSGFDPKRTALLYGSMCHPEMARIAACSGAPFLAAPNCIDAFITREHKAALERGLNVHYLTAGWLRFWKDIFEGAPGWDPVSARMNLGVNDKAILLDSGCAPCTEEDLFELFEYIGLPIEVEPITLDYFQANVLEVCRRCYSQPMT
ncbi:DUF1638 domain-containing protein [Breznakiellaceae bacterium SP9]